MGDDGSSLAVRSLVIGKLFPCQDRGPDSEASNGRGSGLPRLSLTACNIYAYLVDSLAFLSCVSHMSLYDPHIL